MAEGVSADTSAQPLQTLSAGARGAATAVIPHGHRLRREAETLIEGVYLSTFNVEIRSHFPLLIGVLNGEGTVVAAAGCRIASDEPLFLEQYLEEPIELALAHAEGHEIRRDRIGEIGSLATAGGGSPLLFSAIASHLRERGVSHAVATATRRLRRAFAAFGFGAGEIATACPAKLPNSGRDWGRYFEHDPVVVWGRVSAGLRRAETRARL